MKNNTIFDTFIQQYNNVKNEAIALKMLKDYMFSLSSEDMLSFIDYTQSTLFENYQEKLQKSDCSEDERKEIAEQLSSMENILLPESSSKAA
jgi:arginine decarboxylase-like protein